MTEIRSTAPQTRAYTAEDFTDPKTLKRKHNFKIICIKPEVHKILQ